MMDCSATRLELRANRRVGLRIKAILSIGFLAVSACAVADGAADLEDAAARAQYAFLTNDARALQEVLGMVESSQFGDNLAALKSYQLTYGNWKLAQLHSQHAHVSKSRSSAGSKAARACVEHAKATIKLDTRMAEAYALQGICEDKPEAFMQMAGLNSGSCERSRGLRTAQSLAPQNPRVLLIAAVCARPLESKDEVERWRKVVAAFDTAVRPASDVTDWGHAEALTLLGETLLLHNENVAARDAIERALVIAPDYEAARSVLKSIGAHSR